MGRTRTTKYAIWMTGRTPACWDIKQNDNFFIIFLVFPFVHNSHGGFCST